MDIGEVPEIGLDRGLSDITEKVAREYAQRLEYELRGAYRAGYNYLYVGEEQCLLRTTHDKPPTLPKTIYFPAYSEWKPKELVDDADLYRWERYELDAISPAEYRRFVHG